MPARRELKRLYFRWLTWLGRDRRALEHVREQRLVVVLNLHKVSPHANPFWNPLHPDLLDDLVGFLVQHFHVTTFAGLSDAPDDRPAAVLSFDDGYHDFVEYAQPVLARHGVAANQNVVGRSVATGEAPWNVQLYDFLQAAPDAVLRALRVDGLDATCSSTDDASKTRFALALSRHLKLRPRDEREELFGPLAAAMAALDFPRTRMMDVADVLTAATEHEIGSHSWSHESMEFETDAFFREDFARSRASLDALGIPLTTYAFPNGSHRPAQIDWLLDQGVEHVLLVGEDFATRAGPVFRRFTMYGDSASELRMRALGWRAAGGRANGGQADRGQARGGA